MKQWKEEIWGIKSDQTKQDGETDSGGYETQMLSEFSYLRLTQVTTAESVSDNLSFNDFQMHCLVGRFNAAYVLLKTFSLTDLLLCF